MIAASDTEDRGQISFADFSYVLTCVAPTRTRGDAIRMYQEALDPALVEGEPGTEGADARITPMMIPPKNVPMTKPIPPVKSVPPITTAAIASSSTPTAANG